MYESHEEIKQTFGIDITEKNRTIPYVAMRCFYADMKVKILKGKITNRYRTIASEIGCNRDNLYNLLTKAKSFKTDKHTKLIYKAFKNKDKTQLQAYFDLRKQIHVEKRNVMYKKRAFKEYVPAVKVKVLTKFDKNKALMTNLELASFLRANKVLNHPVWETPVKNISQNQWDQVKQMNPAMFDKIVNSKINN